MFLIVVFLRRPAYCQRSSVDFTENNNFITAKLSSMTNPIYMSTMKKTSIFGMSKTLATIILFAAFSCFIHKNHSQRYVYTFSNFRCKLCIKVLVLYNSIDFLLETMFLLFVNYRSIEFILGAFYCVMIDSLLLIPLPFPFNDLFFVYWFIAFTSFPCMWCHSISADN